MSILILFFCFTGIFLFITLLTVEFCTGVFLRIAPPVRSHKKLRQAVIFEIANNYSWAKTAIDLGCGRGGMVDAIARKFSNMKVFGIEIMPLEFACAKIWGSLFGPRNAKFIFGKYEKLLDRAAGFDIAIAYLLPPMMPKVSEFRKKCRIMLVLDFPLPDTHPLKIVELGRHKLFVYEN